MSEEFDGRVGNVLIERTANNILINIGEDSPLVGENGMVINNVNEEVVQEIAQLIINKGQ